MFALHMKPTAIYPLSTEHSAEGFVFKEKDFTKPFVAYKGIQEGMSLWKNKNMLLVFECLWHSEKRP